MRTPKTLLAKISVEKDKFRSTAITADKTKFSCDIYENGEVRITADSNGPRDYYLWNVHRQQRVATYRTASELWEYVWRIIHAGPDRFGLCQLPPIE